MKTVHRFAIALAVFTLALIFLGGMVNSTDSGLAVPDWPLSYGQLMPPMVGGIFYEHSHRMLATFVGFLTVILAFLLQFRSDVGWIKKAGWIALALVIAQGVLGGMTVLFGLPPVISIAHGTIAQSFFCLTVCLAVWTSGFWKSAGHRTELAGRLPLHRGALGIFALSFCQLLLGALLRHTGAGLILHICGAVTLAVLTFWITHRVRREHAEGPIRSVATMLSSLLILQITLGISSYFILSHRFATIPPPLWAPTTVSMHVMIGALFLGLAMIMVLLAYRTRPQGSAPIGTTLGDFTTLTKPGISFMAGLTAVAGFILGSGESVSTVSLVHTCIGTLLAAGGAGTLNMVIEKDIDGRMDRTKARPLPSDRLTPAECRAYGIFLAVSGTLYLWLLVNPLASILAAATVLIYLLVYTPLKKVSTVCVTIGAVAGALPPVVGWAGAQEALAPGALALFGILFLWQYPHFLSLAFMYKDDYAKGGLHMVSDADRVTAVSILLTSAALAAVSLTPFLLRLTGMLYFGAAVAAGAVLMYFATRFFFDPVRQRARTLFFYSLAYVPVLVLFMLLNVPRR